MEEDVEPLVAIEQFKEAIDVVKASAPVKYAAAVRLLERVRSSALELTADGDVIENLGKKTDSAFDANSANPSLSIDDCIEKGTRLEMGGFILRQATTFFTNLECSKASHVAIHGLFAVAVEDDSNPLIALEQFQEAFEVLNSRRLTMELMGLFAFGSLLLPLVSQLLSFDWPSDWRAR